MADIFSSLDLRVLLDGETDTDSPGSEDLLTTLRKAVEGLLILTFGTGVTGTVTGIAETVLTDTANFTASAHVGHTVVITSGDAKGYKYAITSNTVDALTCNGVTMQSDGVAIADEYIILRDLITNQDGHDHDDVNSKAVVNVATNAIGNTEMDDDAIHRAELYTTTEEESAAIAAGNEDTFYPTSISIYGFFPALKCSLAQASDIQLSGGGDDALSTSYDYRIHIDNTAASQETYYAQWGYVRACYDQLWFFLLQDKTTGEIIRAKKLPDHPCVGTPGATPEDIPHPWVFQGNDVFDPDKHNILIYVPTEAEEKQIRKRAQTDGSSPLQVVNELYTLDEAEEADPYWPTDPVTVDLVRDFDAVGCSREGKLVETRAVIPTPSARGLSVIHLKPRKE